MTIELSYNMVLPDKITAGESELVLNQDKESRKFTSAYHMLMASAFSRSFHKEMRHKGIDLQEELANIMNKKSSLSARQRDWVVMTVNAFYQNKKQNKTEGEKHASTKKNNS
jgi:hypothetical protein